MTPWLRDSAQYREGTDDKYRWDGLKQTRTPGRHSSGVPAYLLHNGLTTERGQRAATRRETTLVAPVLPETR